jgi:hypothetical protein
VARHLQVAEPYFPEHGLLALTRSFSVLALNSEVAAREYLETKCWTMMKPLIFTLCFALPALHLCAETSGWQPAPGHTQIPIWPGAVPDAKPVPGPETAVTAGTRWWVAGRPWVGVIHVSQPTMTVYLPEGKNTGAAVVVFPGFLAPRTQPKFAAALLYEPQTWCTSLTIVIKAKCEYLPLRS